MEETIKKLKFKAAGIVINAPAQMENEFIKFGFTSVLDKKIKSKNTLIFINTLQEFKSFLSNELNCLEPDNVLWFAYPKGSSGTKTDINRDILRTTAEQYGITTVAAISIDEIWSGLRFRPINKVGK